MVPVWAVWLGSPVKLVVWLGSRIAAWTGSAVAWKKLKHHPRRTQRFLIWMLVINVVAWLAWAVALWCLVRWKVSGGSG